jgi:hypothetical protein
MGSFLECSSSRKYLRMFLSMTRNHTALRFTTGALALAAMPEGKNRPLQVSCAEDNGRRSQPRTHGLFATAAVARGDRK